MALITYGLSSTRPSPIICRRYFGKIETLKRDSLEVPELIGLGQTSNEESERDGMAMLDAFAAALEVRSTRYTYHRLSKFPKPTSWYRCSTYWMQLQTQTQPTSYAKSFTSPHTHRITPVTQPGTSIQVWITSHGAVYHKNSRKFVYRAHTSGSTPLA